MRAERLSFLQMLKFIRKDMMLLAAGVSPFMIGAVIRFGIPYIEKLLCRFTGLPAILEPYYSLFDIFFTAITPVIFCFIAAMVILEEHDDRIDAFLFVTRLGKRGYFISRIIIPAFVSFVVTAVLIPLFGLSKMTVFVMLFLSLAGTLQGIIIALLVVALSSNKLEGMALTKMSSLIMLGAVVPYFISGPHKYLLSFMPSFWTAMVITESNPVFMILTIAISSIWIFVLWKRFELKIR